MCIHRVSYRIASLIVALAIAGFARSALGVEIDFEDPPYATGTIVGQNGWETNGYIFADPFFGTPGVVNGTVEISTTAPLAGSQSVLYSQTIVPPGAGGSGASDVGQAAAVVGVEDGTPAADITASFLLQADANPVGNGSMGFFLGQGGRSPVFLLVNNINSGAGTGDVLVGHDAVLPSFGSYVPNDVYEFTIGVDLDNQNYDVFARNVTAGTLAAQLAGPGADGKFPFFGGAISDDGDGVTYTLDASLVLRGGTGRIDDLSLVGVPEPATLGIAMLALIAFIGTRPKRS